VVGERLDRVRQVRVVKPEGAPAEAPRVGEFVYLVDELHVPERGRGKRKGGSRHHGGGRPGGKGAAAKPEDLTGGFSFDAMKEDRRREGVEVPGKGRPRRGPRPERGGSPGSGKEGGASPGARGRAPQERRDTRGPRPSAGGPRGSAGPGRGPLPSSGAAVPRREAAVATAGPTPSTVPKPDPAGPS
jgi:hypothetical protein